MTHVAQIKRCILYKIAKLKGKFRSKAFRFPRLPAYPNWQSLASDSHWALFKMPFPICSVVMSRKPNPIHQSNVTRVLKGAVAGGFRITSVKVDKDGSIVLYSHSQEREEREAPRQQTGSNEWDEVLKK